MTGQADIFIADATDRTGGLRAILAEYDLSVVSGAAVALKANFNSNDPFPASSLTYVNPGESRSRRMSGFTLNRSTQNLVCF